jgi:hypothetical protein
MCSIYGDDTNDFAEACASRALGAPKSISAISQDAVSKGMVGADDDWTDANAKLTSRGEGGDGRAATKGNHGKQS